MKGEFLNGRVTVKVGDLTQENVDAIVNAANSTLLGGGGVDGAIHRAAGPELLAECREIRRTQFPEGQPTGEAVLTKGYGLTARHVIHTVGPIYGEAAGHDADLLAACYTNCLRLAAEAGCTTLAFPAISTGVYGYPKEEAAAVASRAIEAELRTLSAIRQLRLVFFDERSAEVFIGNQMFSI